MKEWTLKKKVFTTVISIFVLLMIFLVWSELPREWNPEPYKTNGTLLFEPCFETHPYSVYTKEELKEMMQKISMFKMLTDPHHLKDSIHVYIKFRFMNKSKTGEPAYDFDLPATDGGRIRLSDYKGKIVAFMFGSCT